MKLERAPLYRGETRLLFIGCLELISMKVLEKFPTDFDFAEVYYLNEKLDRYYIPAENNDQSHLIELKSKSNERIALLVIDSGDVNNLYAFHRLDLMSTTPIQTMICAVFGNIAFFIDCLNPGNYMKVSDRPLKDLYQDIANGQLILFFHDRVTAYRGREKAWELILDKLAVDGYSITDITDDVITISYFDFAWGRDRQAAVSKSTGDCEVLPLKE